MLIKEEWFSLLFFAVLAPCRRFMSFEGTIVCSVEGFKDANGDLATSLRRAHPHPEAIRSAVQGYSKTDVVKAVRLVMSHEPAKSWLGRDIAEALPDYPSVLRAVVSHIRQRAIICMPEDVKWADRQF